MTQTVNATFTVSAFQAPDGALLRYGTIGQEESVSHERHPIIFVPGLGGSVKNAIAFLERFVPGTGPVYSLDTRGFGLNENLAPKPTPGRYLKDLSSFISYLQETGPLHQDAKPILMGLSLGGVLTTLYLSEFKHPFYAHVLLAPAFRPHPSLFSTRFKIHNYKNVLLKGLKATTILPYGVQEITRNYDRYTDGSFPDPLKMPTFYLFLIDLLCRKSLTSVSKNKLPTAIVVPQADKVCDPSAMLEAFEQLQSPASKLLTYPEVYHDVCMEPAEDQDRICSDISQWLKEIS